MNNTKEAKELTPNQDLKINAGLMQMWKKAGLRVKSFKATKKGHNEIWSGEFKTKNATLSMSVDKYGSVFYHAGNKSVNIGRLDKQSKIIEWMKAIIKNSPWSESVSESLLDDEKTGYLHMMKMRKSNKTMFWQMTKAMGSDWGKLVKKAEKYGWTKLKESAEPPTLSRNEAFGDLNDAGFKKIKEGLKHLDKVVKKLQIVVKKEDAKETIKLIKGLYDIAGIMYDMIGVPRFYESISEAKKKVDIASLSAGNTYKDSKGYPVKIVDISGSGSSWKITYQDGHGKKKTVKTSLDKGINLYEYLNENAEYKEAALDVLDYLERAHTAAKKKMDPKVIDLALLAANRYWGGTITKDLGLYKEIDRASGKAPDISKVIEKIIKKAETGIKKIKESINEGNLPSNIQKWIRDRGPKPSKDVKMIGKWVKKLTGHEISGGVAIGKNYNTLVLDIEHQDAAIHYDTTSGEIKLYKKKIRSFNDFEKVFQANESVFVNEKIERGNEVHAETKKELKDAIAKSMKEILAGKTPKYDIINGMSGEMIGWKDGKDYVWQPNAIPYAERELK